MKFNNNRIDCNELLEGKGAEEVWLTVVVLKLPNNNNSNSCNNNI